ncbi:MAG: sigma-70 family RNA polymerase sigma factor [Ignavibacteriae bacterium]|nr:sigma-70 family RNA polymerase sigma factor [Ignavibacteriota bacterium]
MLAIPIAPLLALIAELTERNKQDLELLNRIQRRDDRALAALYDRYSSLLYTMAVRIVSAADEAEDIVQEVFVQVWGKSSLYVQERGSVYSWVITLCRNKAIDRVRSKRYKQQSKEVKLEAAAHTADLFAQHNPHQSVVLKEYQDIIAAAKSKLSDIEVKILDMSYFGGYSQTEISQMLKMPLGTVKTNMRQGMIKLRQAITRDATGAVMTTNEQQGERTNESVQAHQRSRRRRGRRGGRNRRGGHTGGGQSQPNTGPGSGGSATS